MRLGAVDMFHLRGHQEMRGLGMPGNGCALVAELAGRVEPRVVERRVEQAARLLPELRFELGGRLAKRWRDSGAATGAVTAAEHRGPLLEAVTRSLDRSLDGRRPWALDLWRGPERDALSLRWFHPLTDARGAARLLGWLGSDDPPPDEGRRWLDGRTLLPAARRERHELARRYFRHVMWLAERPVLGLYRASGLARPGPLMTARLRLDREQSAALYQSLRSRAALADTSVLLFAGARMLDRMLGRRGFSPPRYVAPVPLSLDKKPERERMFGNHVTMMMLYLDRDELGAEQQAVQSLARQRREIVRDRLDVGMLAALDLASPLPSALYSWSQRRPFAGERGSFVLSNPGTIELESLFGQAVADAYLVPTALCPPGFQLIAQRHGGALSLVVGWCAGTAERAEIDDELGRLQGDLVSPVGPPHC